MGITVVSGANSYATNTLASEDETGINPSNQLESESELTTTSAHESVKTMDEQNGPDLAMTKLTAPTGGAPGGQIIIPNTVKNQGNTASGGFYVTYYLTPTQNFDNAILLGSRYIPSDPYLGIFGPGVSNSDNTVFTVPNTASGSYYIAARADGYENVAETDENNNGLFSNYKINIKDGRDLLVTSITAPATGIRGRTFTVSNTVKNQGNMATGGFYVSYYLTTFQNMNEQIKIGSRYIKSLSAGASNTANTVLEIPANIAMGLYYIGVLVDTTKQINEVNEANNIGFSDFKINVKDGRDLFVSSVTAPAIGFCGRTITVANTVKNQGNMATGGFYVSYYLTTFQNMNERIKIGSRYIKSLSAGASNTANTVLKIPANIAMGQFYIGAIADTNNQINEVNEANNNGYSSGKFNVTTDNTAPKVIKITPVSNAMNVPVNKVITVTLNEPIKAGRVWIELYNCGTKKLIPLTIIISGNVLTIKHALLVAGNKYMVCLHTGSVTDLAGNPLTLWGSKFITTTDTKAPVITSSNPANNALNVVRNKLIRVSFSEAIKAGTMWIELYNSAGTKKLIPLTKSISGNVLTIRPAALLTAGTKYILCLHTGSVTDLAGNPLTLCSRRFSTGWLVVK